MTQESGAYPGSAAQVAQYFEGVDFPKSKQDLIRHAEQRGAPGDVRRVIERLPERTYQNMADVMHGLGETGGFKGT